MTLTTKISSDGSVELPASVRDANGWAAGTELEIIERGQEIVLRPRVRRTSEELSPPITLEEFFARVPKVSGPYPTEVEIEALVLTEAARRFDEKTRR